jgi:hypothetical protein
MGGVRNTSGTRAAIVASVALAMTVGLIAGPAGATGTNMPSPGAVDLTVEFMTHPNPVASGSSLQLESVIRNEGTLLADRVESVFEVSAAGVSAQFGSNPCTAVGSTRLESDGTQEDKPWTVTCDLGDLPPGSEARISLSVSTGSSGTHLATVTASSAQADSRPDNNTTQIPVHVLPSAPEFTPAFQQPGRLNPSSRTTA